MAKHSQLHKNGAAGSRTRSAPFPSGACLFTRMFTRLGCSGRPPHFVVEFYPYAGLVQTIRLRDDVAYIRFSDLMQAAPARVLEAAAAVLLAKLYRRRLPADLDDAYREYSLAQHTRRRAQRLRSRRAQRITLAPAGAHHNLTPLFDQLNQRYFAGALRRPHIGWSARPWHKQLGCFDPALDQIVLSSRLDHPRVPRCVVEYVLYHEMLHVKHPVRRAPARCGLETHSPRFRTEEKRYTHYAAARRFLLRLR
ncbi:MAG: M48 family peptidase [Candidatus Acidiferrales bacterium]